MTPIMVLSLQNEDIDEKEKDSKALYGMIALGFGEIFGGLLMGLIIDKIGSRATCLLNVLFVATAGGLSMLVIY